MCKFTPSSELDDISSADRKIQPFWRCLVGILRVKSSTKKYLTIKLLAQLLGQKYRRCFLPSQIKMQTDVIQRKSSRRMMGHPRDYREGNMLSSEQSSEYTLRLLLEISFIIKHVRSISFFHRPQTFKKSVGFRSAVCFQDREAKLSWKLYVKFWQESIYSDLLLLILEIKISAYF